MKRSLAILEIAGVGSSKAAFTNDAIGFGSLAVGASTL